MKECKGKDPARTDRVSVWISKADESITVTDISTISGVDINIKNISGDILTNFKF